MKFLLFAWAWMPKTNSRKNSDSPTLIGSLELKGVVPNLSDIKSSMDILGARMSSVVNNPVQNSIEALVEELPSVFQARVMDVSVMCANALESIDGRYCNTRWGLCFDELEISPKWLREELLGSTRSIDQRFVLKLTWSPILPQGHEADPESTQDFDSIRLWYSHIVDAHDFCNELATRAIQGRLGVKNVTAEDLLGSSLYAREERVGADSKKMGAVYERSGNYYDAMKNLASFDESFSLVLKEHGLDPCDPYTESIELRDKLLRKIKPIVLLRETFLNRKGKRSRKRPALYAGKEVAFAMSEGNPRRLLNLINDLIDLGVKGEWRDIDLSNVSSESPIVVFQSQAKILSAASNNFLMSIRAIPCNRENSAENSLYSLVDRIGKYLHSRLFSNDFPVDVNGSFRVEEDVDEALSSLLKTGLDRGAFVYVGASQQDVPTKVESSRLRLSFMLSPSYRVLMRNDPPASLYTCISASPDDSNQMVLEL
ncbi:hypothetical protein BOW53_16090 [Solemya pervernicosa gill symbiont]|uniref:Uncharacterized protein n=1 Tax=Solemya pervernicosa gill symbiont TaxID=642797 RepID=A0A1T2KZP4_9GAMM|nr:hypothetical protein BOW53_16090 [Solemya pervernicosa gill symbiont]